MSEAQPEKNVQPIGNEQGHQLSIRREDVEETSGEAVDEPAEKEASSEVVAEAGLPEQRPQRHLFKPPIDIFGTEQGLVLRADLPGVCIERLDLQIEDNKLTLFGRVEEAIPEGARLLHGEYQVGDFYRSFILSDEVDYERISAKMNLGVLEVTLPRVPRAKPRKIHVQSE